jgi:hypothetical protein
MGIMRRELLLVDTSLDIAALVGAIAWPLVVVVLAVVFRGALGEVFGTARQRSLRPMWSSETGRMRTRRPRPAPVPRSDFAGFRFPRDVIVVIAVRWYLRFGLSYRDVEELLAERGVEKAAAGRGRHRPGSDLSGRAGGTPPGGVASHRAVRQQPGRGRPWASEGAAAIDARLQARPQRWAS